MAPTLTERADAMAEGIAQRAASLEQRWCAAARASCHGMPDFRRCSAFCAQGSQSLEAEESHATVRDFGLPEFRWSGYSLGRIRDAPVPDCASASVGRVLGLATAVHRATSVQRLCLRQAKFEIPAYSEDASVRRAIEALKRLDHVNILALLEAYEDADSLYLLYEHIPCCTLGEVLAQHSWSQEQAANLVREVCGAVHAACQSGVVHIGLSLHHVLLHARAARGADPMVAKVFGFGLLGCVLANAADRTCWAPEALQTFSTEVNFIARMEGWQRMACDSWSLGVIAYSVVARLPPMRSEEDVLLKRWSFTLDIDMVDPPAHVMIERLLDPRRETRLKAEAARESEWIRKRWRPPHGAEAAFLRVLEFCRSPLPNRLFGRFLGQFLEAKHTWKIAWCFYALDTQGAGVITARELELAAASALAGHATRAAVGAILGWLAPPGAAHVPFRRFAECFAEDVIDGCALRRAFEGLDDDGSEQVTKDELFEALRAVDEEGALSAEAVAEYISACEGGAGEDCGGDHGDQSLDYEEFCRLFPKRVKRIEGVKRRIAAERASSLEMTQQLADAAGGVEQWLRGADGLLESLGDLASKALDRSDAARRAAIAMHGAVPRVQQHLSHPPGPLSAEELQARMHHRRHQLFKEEVRAHDPFETSDAGSGRHHHRREPEDYTYGFGSFLQDQAALELFPTLLRDDVKILKDALGDHSAFKLDVNAAHDVATSVCDKVRGHVRRARRQLEEYKAFAEAMREPEALLSLDLGGPRQSGRGLPRRGAGESPSAARAPGEAAGVLGAVRGLFARP